MPLGATAGGGTSLACGFAALPGYRAGSRLGEPAAPSGPSPVLWEFPPQLCPSDWWEMLGPTRWHPRVCPCSGSQAQSGTCFFGGLACGTTAGPALVLLFLSIPGLHTAGRRLAHPGGCRIDQLNAELMMRVAEPGAWGHCRGHSCSLSCSCQEVSSCPQACPGLPVCAVLQLWLPAPTLPVPVLLVPTLLLSMLPVPTSPRGAGGNSPWLQSSQLPPAPEVRGTRVLVPPQCALWEAVPALPDSRAQRAGALCPLQP